MLSISLVFMMATLLRCGRTQESLQCPPEGCPEEPPVHWERAAEELFGDYFLTEDKAAEVTEEWIHRRMDLNMEADDPVTNQGEISQGEAHHTSKRCTSFLDYDRCCQSRLVMRRDWWMRNYQGIWRQVVHMTWTKPRRYQWYLQGTCWNSEGECTGRCRQRKTLVSMLVYVNERVTFEWFPVNGYCSCQSR